MRRQAKAAAQLPPPEQRPRHVGIIMDGNGRWAKRRALPRTAGHAAGSETFRRVATHARDRGIQALTVYAFSTENWRRPKDEVDAILDLLARYLREAIQSMARDGVRLRFLGDLSVLPAPLLALVREADAVARTVEGMVVSVGFNYGGRDEILRAARTLSARCQAGLLAPEQIDEALFSSLLDTAPLPPLDLLIRPSGEFRLSNFLLWQAAYAELYFTNVLWPDFSPAEFDRALSAFAARERRYGGVS
ncbi:MAG: di-trans,poly-cis-decaprenylcistransferase [Oscillospiraceae bacterium]|nr:di-trans,poly-cis-decaprenylcistransferase [Oscillospiraceae bacterium]